MAKKESKGLKALRAVDFQWTVHVDSVWTDPEYHIRALHESIRDDLLYELADLKMRRSSTSPLGWVVTGAGGVGKTHLLQTLRRDAAIGGAGFVFVDMTGIHDFWGTILQAYLDSLQRPYLDGVPQYAQLLEYLIDTIVGKPVGRKKLGVMATMGAEETVSVIQLFLRKLAVKYRHEVLKYQDTIRALVLLRSESLDMLNIGYSWLQGFGINKKHKKTYGFEDIRKNPKEIVQALSWLMALKHPVILAMDQMDAIVTQHYLGSGIKGGEGKLEEQKVSQAIIEGIGGGLSSLRDVTSRTLMVVSCLESTWEIIRETLSTNADRYREPVALKKVGRSSIAREMVAQRLAKAYRKKGFVPKYPSWPFTTAAFKVTDSMLPRQILQNCEKHRRKCLKKGKIIECENLDISAASKKLKGARGEVERLTKAFKDLRKQADPAELRDTGREDTVFASLLEVACRCLQREITLPDNVDCVVDQDFAGGKSYSYLHARLRLVFREEDEREEHFCLRAILKKNAIAYQNRLKAAMTTSGIDRNLPFRRLVIVRNMELPGGVKSRELTDQFKQNGGSFAGVLNEELCTLWALQQLEKQNDSQFEPWLKKIRPASRLQFMRVLAPGLCGVKTSKAEEEAGQSAKEKSARKGKAEKKKRKKEKNAVTKEVVTGHQDGLAVGRRLSGTIPGEPVLLAVKDLVKHTVILAGSGSGKTVLVRHLVEEAALRGIPSIVIDCANDLALLGDRWPQWPEEWHQEEIDRAVAYHQQAEVVVWTPGIEKGNPMKLEPLPDLSAVQHDRDELEQAVGMVRDALQPVVAPGNSQKSQKKLGILHAALDYYARQGQGGLDGLIELLADIPAEAGGEISQAEKLALEMADSLRAQKQTDILLKQRGAPLDPAQLFGIGEQMAKTRISVINLCGLPALGSQQQFVNQLAMTLFTWIKKNPAPAGSPLRGLLVIDEAKDFVPNVHSAACKNSLLRLAAQARKYGLGLIFATQAPKSIDHNIIANCNTHFYGKANSPAAIKVVEEQLRSRGGSGKDVPRLGVGEFYFYSEETKRPIKLKTPLCLSHHPPTPPAEEEIIRLAQKTDRATG